MLTFYKTSNGNRHGQYKLNQNPIAIRDEQKANLKEELHQIIFKQH